MSAKKLQISPDLALPLSAVTSTIVIYGGKGMGKTNLGGVLIEEFSAAGLRWAVVDPMGVWWGIRHKSDGVGKGVECLILGGAHGDIPIEPTGGAVVADLVADERVNVVIDISRKPNGEFWSIGERIRFMVDYGKQLYKRQGSLVNGKRREPICQVIDEAARFIPQMIRSNEDNVAACAGIWSAIVEEGRNVGIGVVLLTQRNARLNKDVAELADAMLAFRTIGPKSLDAVTDWLGAHLPKAQLQALSSEVRSLPVGSCLLVSPGWLGLEKVIAIRKRWTFDSSATPKPGESTKAVKGQGAVPDLKLYAARMNETIERAKQDSVPELKKRVRELEAQVAKPVKAAVAVPAGPREITEREKAAILRPYLAERRTIAQRLKVFAMNTAKAITALTETQSMAEKALEGLLAEAPEDLHALLAASGAADRVAGLLLPLPPTRSATPVAERPARPREVAASGEGGARLTGKALQIAAIAAGYAERGEGIDKKLLAAILGVSMNGSFYNRISEARTAGAIVTEGNDVLATPEGMAQYADAFQAPSTMDEVVALWRPKLTGKAREIFDQLVELRGSFISRADLAAVTGQQMNGSFYNRLSEVRATGLLREQGKDVSVNPALLFLEK